MSAELITQIMPLDGYYRMRAVVIPPKISGIQK